MGEVQAQVIQTEESLQALKVEFSNSNNVVDISEAMAYIRIFRDKAFYKLSVRAQADILKGRVRRIVVKDHGILAVEIFGRKQGMVYPFGGRGSKGGNESKGNGIDGHCGAEIRSAITSEGIENSADLENKVLKLKNPVEAENCPIRGRTGVRTGIKLVAGVR